jgi:Metallo-peptidase family M12B Reprolysin-like/Bacterial Ig domain
MGRYFFLIFFFNILSTISVISFAQDSTDLDIQITAPDIVLFQEQYEFKFLVTNNTTNVISPDSMYIQLIIDDNSKRTSSIENWSVVHSFNECEFTHPWVRSIMFSSRGERFRCSQLPDIDVGDSLSFSVIFKADELAHYFIVGGIGTTAFPETRIMVHPSLVDTDNDGVIDTEENLADSDPLDDTSQPSNSDIDLLLFYTPDFAASYDSVQREDFFNGFIDYANEVFRNSKVRIELNLAGAYQSGPLNINISGTQDHYSELLTDAANRRDGFEQLALLERTLSFDIVGVIDTTNAFALGRANGITSGSPRGFFSAIDTYRIILHEIGHNLGADHDYNNRSAQDIGGDGSTAFNFSFGYKDGFNGTIMSATFPFFSNPDINNCGLPICGIEGLIRGEAADNALTLNLRRLFMSNTSDLDQDYDGIPDWYEQNQGVITDHDHCLDADGDGVPNVGEFKALTDPLDPGSMPSNYDLSEDCESPVDKVANFEVGTGDSIDLDLRVFDSNGRLLKVIPESGPTVGNLDWNIYSWGLYTYTPNPGFEGTDEINFTISNGIAGSANYNVTIQVKDPGELDNDDDGIPNKSDNCKTITNENQNDTDGDGLGNACDNDDDNDGITDSYETLHGLNPEDVADASLDKDSDGVSNLEEFQLGRNASVNENAVILIINSILLEDIDTDKDGVPDNRDTFPLDPNESVDTDRDGVGNNADSDDDGDGLPDSVESENGMNPLFAGDGALDKDADGLINLEEFTLGSDINTADTDGDGINDGVEIDAGRNPTVDEAAVLPIINSILLEE